MSLNSTKHYATARTTYGPAMCVAFVALALLLPGCKEESIHSYVAPKAKPISMTPPMTASGPAEPTRMLAAILRQPEKTWFFKLTAPPEEAAALREQFGQFVASTTFTNDQPSWEVPEDWIETPGNQFRYVTYQMGAAAPNSVFRLCPVLKMRSRVPWPISIAGADSWACRIWNPSNIKTRWLPTTTPKYCLKTKEKLSPSPHPAGSAILVDFVGEMSSGGGPPFANMGRPQAAPATLPSTSSDSATFSPPKSWKQGELSSMRKAAYVVGEGENSLEITVIPLSSQSGSLLDNVNRWRGQVQLPDWTEQELSSANKNLIGQGFTADYVKLVGSEETILGAIISRGDRNWFIKLKGPNDLAEQETENFEQFVKAIEF